MEPHLAQFVRSIGVTARPCAHRISGGGTVADTSSANGRAAAAGHCHQLPNNVAWQPDPLDFPFAENSALEVVAKDAEDRADRFILPELAGTSVKHVLHHHVDGGAQVDGPGRVMLENTKVKLGPAHPKNLGVDPCCPVRQVVVRSKANE